MYTKLSIHPSEVYDYANRRSIIDLLFSLSSNYIHVEIAFIGIQML